MKLTNRIASDYATIPDEPLGYTPTEPSRLDELCREAGLCLAPVLAVLWTPALGARVVEVRELEGEK